MNDAIAIENFRHAMKRIAIQTLLFVAGAVFVLGAVAGVQKALAWITDLHWIAGLIAAILVLAGLVWLLSYIKNASLTLSSFGRYPKIGLALNLLLVVVSGVVAMAFCSSILRNLDVVHYVSAEPVTVARLMDYYGYHFLDSLPVFAISDLLGVESRIEAGDTPARVLLELFRVLIVAAVIQTFLTKRGNFRTQLKHAQTYRQLNDLAKAELMMDVALKSARSADSPVDLADANIELARILADRSPDRARQHLDEAQGYIEDARRASDLESRQDAIKALRSAVA